MPATTALASAMAYWRGVRGRLMTAAIAGIIVGLVMWWLLDPGGSVIVALVTFVSAALLPPRRPKGQPPA